MPNRTRDPISGAVIYTLTPEEKRQEKEKKEAKSYHKKVRNIETELDEIKARLIRLENILSEKGML